MPNNEQLVQKLLDKQYPLLKLSQEEIRFLNTHPNNFCQKMKEKISQYPIEWKGQKMPLETLIKKIDKQGCVDWEKIVQWSPLSDFVQIYLLVHNHGNGLTIDGGNGKHKKKPLGIRENLPSKEPSVLNQKESKGQNYLLSKEDFKRYFEGEDFKQRNIGDCWLLATIDSLVSWWKYEEYIRKSVKKTDKGFLVCMPLGTPWNHGKWVNVDVNQTAQIAVDGTPLYAVNGEIGIKALIQAYGKIATGKEVFDVYNLHWWSSAAAMNTLISGIKVYQEVREKREGQEALDPYGKKGILPYKLKIALAQFDPKTDMLTLSVNQLQETSGDRSGYAKSNYDALGHYSNSNHSISVEKTFLKNGELMIQLSNPWDSSGSYIRSFESLLPSCYGFCLWTTKNRDNIFIKTNDKDINKREFTSKDVQYKLDSRLDSLNQIIQNQWEFNTELSISRGDVIVSEKNGKLFVSSWWKNDSYVELKDTLSQWDDKKRTLNIAGKKLILNTDHFSTIYNNEQKDKYRDYLYLPRLTVFINKMRYDYIDKKMAKSGERKPFSLDNQWNLIFAIERTKVGWIIDKVKIGLEWLLGDSTINCLSDRSLLGINPNNTKVKQQIVNFLNQLYN